MKKIRVVLVEDDPMVLEVNGGFVAAVPGFTVVGTARTGEQALQVVEQTKPDLVVLDIYLPDRDGMQLITDFRSRGWPVDVIAVSAAQDGETVQHMLRFGVVDYIIKPFKFNRFKAALENYRQRCLRLQAKSEVLQGDIDRVNTASLGFKAAEELPKGLNQATLEQVKFVLEQTREGFTAEEIAERSGIARVTARRYLEYLEMCRQVVKEIQYGSVGRPVHRFRLR